MCGHDFTSRHLLPRQASRQLNGAHLTQLRPTGLCRRTRGGGCGTEELMEPRVNASGGRCGAETPAADSRVRVGVLSRFRSIGITHLGTPLANVPESSHRLIVIGAGLVQVRGVGYTAR